MKVNESCAAVKEQADYWSLARALLEGTEAMRKLGQKFLPKRVREHKDDYEIRLNQATLFPAFSETINSLTGRVFAKPLVEDGVPSWIVEEVFPNADLEDRSFNTFAFQCFYMALGMGAAFVLVESPPLVDPAGNPIRTAQDQKNAKLRPYLISIDPQRILGWRQKNGTLTQVRIQFTRIAEDGEFGQEEIPQVRVYDLLNGKVQVRVYEKVKDKDEFAEVVGDRRTIDLDFIPLAVFYAIREKFMVGKSPLRELAHLNAKHWAQQSANDALVDIASVPILVGTGIDEETEIVVGAKTAVSLPVGADLKFCEHTGKAIEAGRKSLEELKDQMQEAGAKLLVRESISMTATQATEESQRDNSALGRMTMNYEDFLVSVLDMIAAYRQEKAGGKAKLNPNLDPAFQVGESVKFLLEMRNGGALSDRTLFEEVQRHGWLSEEIDWEDEQLRLSGQPDAAPALPGAGATPPPE